MQGDDSVGHGEEGVVPPPADVAPGVELRAMLADEDATGMDELAAVCEQFARRWFKRVSPPDDSFGWHVDYAE